MPTLHDIQSAFIDALTHPAAPVPQAIGKKDGTPVKRRFDVYRNNVAAGMIDALRVTFPAIEVLVGEAFFAACARAYLEHRPPCSPLLFRYGDRFGDFLDDFPPASSIPYLGDVARLEWARLEAYHARDDRPLPIGALGKLLDGDTADVGRLRFGLHPSLALLRSRWPIVSLWAASTGQGSSDDVDMKASERAMIVRPSLAVETHRLPEGGFVFLSAIDAGDRLEDAANRAMAVADGFDLATQLQGLFAVGAVSAINDEAT